MQCRMRSMDGIDDASAGVYRPVHRQQGSRIVPPHRICLHEIVSVLLSRQTPTACIVATHLPLSADR